jgi:hypothetical protein
MILDPTSLLVPPLPDAGRFGDVDDGVVRLPGRLHVPNQ